MSLKKGYVVKKKNLSLFVDFIFGIQLNEWETKCQV